MHGRSSPPRIDKAVFPFLQGGPLMHAVAAKAVALKRVPAAGLPDYAAAGRRQRAGARRGRWRPRACGPVSGGTDTHLALIDLRGVGVTGRGGREPAATRPASR